MRGGIIDIRRMLLYQWALALVPKVTEIMLNSYLFVLSSRVHSPPILRTPVAKTYLKTSVYFFSPTWYSCCKDMPQKQPVEALHLLSLSWSNLRTPIGYTIQGKKRKEKT